MKVRKMIVAAMLGTATMASQAGTFHTVNYGDDTFDNVAGLISDIVTDGFTKQFPSNKFAIVVIYGTTVGSSTVCYAVAGITPQINSGKDAVVPNYRFVTTKVITSNNLADKRQCEKDVIRGSVDDMMAIPPAELAKKAL